MLLCLFSALSIPAVASSLYIRIVCKYFDTYPGSCVGANELVAELNPRLHSRSLASMSTSLRNSLHRRNHKERGQLAHRTRLGILEKHKDYVLRARDYHSKQNRIQRLKEKAANRNQDEFYFGMVNQRTKVCRYPS